MSDQPDTSNATTERAVYAPLDWAALRMFEARDRLRQLAETMR